MLNIRCLYVVGQAVGESDLGHAWNMVEALKGKIQRLPFVKDVVESYRPFVKTEYENAKPDKAKEYDYKIGL